MSPIATSAFGDAGEQQSDEAPKRKRRSRAEMIADAVVPDSDDKVDLKDLSTGQKYERTWLVAVEMVRDGKAEFVKRDLKYAVMKMDEQKGPPPKPAADARPSNSESVIQDAADGLERRWLGLQEELDETSTRDSEKIKALSDEAEQVRQKLLYAGYQDVQSDEAYERRGRQEQIPFVGVPEKAPTKAKGQGDSNIPPDAEVGDEVTIGTEILRVGHGRVLTSGVIGNPDGTIIKARRRWQRELGTGKNGPWEVTHNFSDGGVQEPGWTPNAFSADASTEHVATVASSGGEDGDGSSEMTPVSSVQRLSDVVWRVSAGYLEKIGLPKYSSLQIGPVVASREISVLNPSDVTKIVREDGTEISAPREVVEGLRGNFQACEISMRYERGAMLSFLEAARPGIAKSS